MKILVINPGSTSTKLAVYEDDVLVWRESLYHSAEEVAGFRHINEQYDEGAILFQAKCPLLPTDTPEEVAAKVHALEYQYYPQVIERLLA